MLKIGTSVCLKCIYLCTVCMFSVYVRMYVCIYVYVCSDILQKLYMFHIFHIISMLFINIMNYLKCFILLISTHKILLLNIEEFLPAVFVIKFLFLHMKK